jgi:hypothetical protein
MKSDSKNHSNNEPQDEAIITLEAIFQALPDLLFWMDSSDRILSTKLADHLLCIYYGIDHGLSGVIESCSRALVLNGR